MITTTHRLGLLRQHYTPDTRYLFRILLNATSVVEANIALDLLLKTVPERPLVAAVSLREVLKALPTPPFPMAVDEQTLVGAAGLEKRLAVLLKRTPDDYDVIVTTAGNLVLDLIIKEGDTKHFWTPMPVTSDYVAPALVDPLITSDHLLDSVVELIVAMGIVFNPTLYLSLDDWHLDYASETMEDLGNLF
jgi:hypothetical protein